MFKAKMTVSGDLKDSIAKKMEETMRKKLQAAGLPVTVRVSIVGGKANVNLSGPDEAVEKAKKALGLK